MFELFVQGDRPGQRRADGLGIGLTIVRRIVELHGGTVQAESDGAQAGARFTVLLPSAVGTGTDAGAPPAVPRPAGGCSSWRTTRTGARC